MRCRVETGMKRFAYIVLCSVTILFFITQNAQGLPAQDVQFLIDRQYFSAVKRLIDGARHSVQVMMFEACYYHKHTDSATNQLIDALIEAKKRGLTVDVILEINKHNERTTTRNLEAGTVLKKAGICVFVDKDTVTTHTKLLIIDKKIVIIGSTNWTFSALARNHEISAVIYSEESADVLQGFFEKVKKEGKKL